MSDQPNHNLGVLGQPDHYAVLPQSSAGQILPKCGLAGILFTRMPLICELEV